MMWSFKKTCRTLGSVQNVHKTLDLQKKVLEMLSYPKYLWAYLVQPNGFGQDQISRTILCGPNVL